MSNYIQDDEVGRYKKQTKSNISKSNRKSKHKHQYEECLIQYRWNFKSNIFSQEQKDKIHTSLQSYCTICGKIGDKFKEENSIVKDYRRIVETPIVRCYQMISSKELYERYHDKMPVFFVEDIFKDKYVDLEQNYNSERE